MHSSSRWQDCDFVRLAAHLDGRGSRELEGNRDSLDWAALEEHRSKELSLEVCKGFVG